MNDFFEIGTDQLWKQLQALTRSLDEQLNAASPEAKFTALTAVLYAYHLREWICPRNKHLKGAKGLPPESPAEVFFCGIYDNCESFETLSKIANGTKHGAIRLLPGAEASVIEGAHCGVERCGDSLGRMYLMLGNKNLFEEILLPAIRYYSKHWFDVDRYDATERAQTL